ncbi:hypothetical protein ACM01_34685 [Streptomyces viridochromogenes]|uniref:Uncharacterized protein n=1 Tax=Streptomyces viridochromogenes TaxID=1938 RepID=A0A0J8BVK3_STRVR|nr:hypothetical protein [Streptomyces viridochromogenes]KMS69575.1 hypothetical protein ACM01_34685 [Streptomyces viridochromogenes]KOG14213.1 hypothetical protein ADK35_31145 [Streptomyces viridochromogenes]KOG15540.1 hypothetical protein ADK36_29100 [Streptomyces viridochromogenes]
MPSIQRLLPSISRANADQGEPGTAAALADAEALAVAPAVAAEAFVAAVFDEHPVIRGAEAGSPPVSMALRCGSGVLTADGDPAGAASRRRLLRRFRLGERHRAGGRHVLFSG